MDKFLNALQGEPVRLRIYSLVALVAVYLVARGVISVADMEFIVSVAGVVLVVESARSKVSPVPR